ncbi:MAG: hypothetical protein K1X42_10100 [Opitutaceae bacterium]|nr:hypothetical protein [Opitutaceae bacterium]
MYRALYPLSTTHALRLCLISALACCLIAVPMAAAEVAFDLPADTLENSAKRFSTQSGFEILLPGDAVADLRTQPVRGRMAPLKALEAMVAGTGLTVLRDPKSGAFAIKRESAPPNAPRATSAAADVSPAMSTDSNSTMKKTKKPLAYLAALFGLAATPVASSGQGLQPSPGSTLAKDDQPIELTPFTVTADTDVGYVAVNALAGGRTEAPLRLTPSSVSAMTTEFLQDLGIGDMREALQWTLNAEPGNAEMNTASQGGQLTNFRATGGAGNYPSRNYFVYYGVADTYNTERFEFARGPNAVLFGEAQLGGVATTFTKVPRFQNFYRGTLRYTYPSTGDGSFRATMDLNQMIGKRVALRVNALGVDGRSWRDFSDQSNRAVTASIVFKISDRTQLRIEGDSGKKRFNLFATNYSDGASYWNGAYRYNGSNALTGAAATAAGVSRITSARNVWIPAVPQAGVSNWVNSYTSAGTGLGLLDDVSRGLTKLPVLPSYRFTLAPTDAYSQHRDRSGTIFIDHRFSDALQAQVATYYYDLDIFTGNNVFLGSYTLDLNEFLPNGQRNPKVGVPFSEARPSVLRARSVLHETRGLVTYKFDLPTFFSLHQRFTLIAGRRSENYETSTKFLQQVAGPGQSQDFNAAAMQIFYRYYWDEPLEFGMGKLPTDSSRTLAYVNGTQPGNLIKSLKDLDYAQLSSLTTLFGDRVSLMLGVRHDRLNMRRQGPIASVAVNNNQPQLGFGGVVGNWETIRRKVTSPSLGGVAFITPWLGVFGNISKNFNPPTNGAPDVDGNSLQGPRGEGKDYGLKINLLDGQIYATLTRYESNQTGRIIAIQNELTRLRQIWTNVGSNDVGQTTVDFRDTESIEASGYEAEIVANPTRQIRLSGGIAFPDTKIIERLPGLSRYFQDHLATWESALASGKVSDATALQNNINAIRQTIESSTQGTRLDRTPDYRWNIYSSYSFTDGPLKGFSFGGGLNGRGRIKVGTRDARILFNTTTPTNEQRRAAGFSEIKAPATYTAAVRFGYQFRIGRIRSSVQLNVNNLFDTDDPEWRTSSTFTPPGGVLTQAYSTYTLPSPRTFVLTTSFDF